MKMRTLAAALLLGALWAAAAHATVFDYTGTVQTFDVTTTGLYDITAYGAQGGGADGGEGAEIGGDVHLTSGTVLTVIGGGGGGNYSGGGGGSTWVTDGAPPLVVAGGGGGSGTCCGAFGQGTPGTVPGGPGLALSSGSGSISPSYIPGSIALGSPSNPCCGGGGSGGTAGGFGDESPGVGGLGGPGGGYSDGTFGCGSNGYGGCGGSSFLASTVTQLVSIAGENSGNGSVSIVGAPAPEAPAWATLLVGLGLGVFVYRRNNKKSAAAPDAA